MKKSLFLVGIGVMFLCLLLLMKPRSGEISNHRADLETSKPVAIDKDKDPIIDNDLESDQEKDVEKEVEVEASNQDTQANVLKLLSEMTLAEKIGQIFFARVPVSDAIEDIKHYHLGGYLLFRRDFEGETPTSFQEKVDSYQEAATIPMLIGSDEEGGTVSRISRVKGFLTSPFQSPQELYAEGGMDKVKSDAQAKSEILKSYGINVNLAPDVDIANVSTSFIYNRTVGLDVEGTSTYVETVITAMEEAHIGSSLKHFPGYGDNGDSHMEMTYDNRSLSQLRQNDFLPFQAGIAAGADSILVSHNILTTLQDHVPASVNPEIYQIIRNELKFDGVALTDDMDMAGLADYMSQEEAAVVAIQAGADMILTSHYQEQSKRLLQAVEDGELSEKRIDESVLRILQWKQELGLLAF